jgi:hypothetical protein
MDGPQTSFETVAGWIPFRLMFFFLCGEAINKPSPISPEMIGKQLSSNDGFILGCTTLSQ